MGSTAESRANQIEVAEACLRNVWAPLLPEQEASIRQRPDILNFFVQRGRGITAEMIARRPDVSLSISTIRNAKGLGARIVGAVNSDQAVLKLVHAGIIPLEVFETPQDQEIFEKIKMLIEQPNGRGKRNHFLLKAAAAGATIQQVADVMRISPQTVDNDYARLLYGNGQAEGLETADMLIAGLAYLRYAGSNSVREFLPSQTREATSSYEFSHLITPTDLPAIFARQKPIYHYLAKFDPNRLHVLCENLTEAEKIALEAYAKVGSIQTAGNGSVHTFRTQLRTAQAILGTQTPEQAALIYLAAKRELPSPDQFGLTNQQLVALINYAQYYGRNTTLEDIDRINGLKIGTTENYSKKAYLRLGTKSTDRAILELVNRGFPIDELLFIPKNLDYYISQIQRFERETLQLFLDPHRGNEESLSSLSRGTISSRLSRLTQTLDLSQIQILLIFRKAEILEIVDSIDPTPRENVSRNPKPI